MTNDGNCISGHEIMEAISRELGDGGGITRAIRRIIFDDRNRIDWLSALDALITECPELQHTLLG